MKKLIPAIVMLLVSAVVLSTASYAWFTTSQDVAADGMSVTAQAPTSILIRDEAKATAATNPDTKFYANITFDTASNKLQPASSGDGRVFYAAAQCEDFTGAMLTNSAINTVSGTGYYIDYTVTLKNTSTTHSVNLGVGDFTFADADIALNGAVRVAILKADKAATYGIFYPLANSNDPSYVNVLSAPNTVANAAVGPLYIDSASNNALQTPETWNKLATGKAVTWSNWGTTVDATGYYPNNTDVVSLDPLEEETVVIRLWIEGQSAACVTSNASLTSGLSITFVINDATAVS